MAALIGFGAQGAWGVLERKLSLVQIDIELAMDRQYPDCADSASLSGRSDKVILLPGGLLPCRSVHTAPRTPYVHQLDPGYVLSRWKSGYRKGKSLDVRNDLLPVKFTPIES